MANVDISKISLEQLKALAYDQITQIEQAQANLRLLNTEIARRSNTVPVVHDEPKTKKNSKAEAKQEAEVCGNM